jgi:hypothetical protein
MAKLDEFSRSGLKQKWVASITDNAVPGRSIRVCFERLSDEIKNSIAQCKTDLLELEHKMLMENETDRFIDDLRDKVEGRRFFRMNSPKYYDEVLSGKVTAPMSTVLAKIAVGVYEFKDDDKIILMNVTDAEGKIKEGEAYNSRSYSLYETPEDRIIQIISDATNAIIREYPIEGRITDVSGDGQIVEIGVGRLAGIRNRTRLYAYCGDMLAGEVVVTACWPSTCEGTWMPNLVGHEADTSFIVCSKKKEHK